MTPMSEVWISGSGVRLTDQPHSIQTGPRRRAAYSGGWPGTVSAGGAAGWSFCGRQVTETTRLTIGLTSRRTARRITRWNASGAVLRGSGAPSVVPGAPRPFTALLDTRAGLQHRTGCVRCRFSPRVPSPRDRRRPRSGRAKCPAQEVRGSGRLPAGPCTSYSRPTSYERGTRAG